MSHAMWVPMQMLPKDKAFQVAGMNARVLEADLVGFLLVFRTKVAAEDAYPKSRVVQIQEEK